jgi:hypothetical protein
VRYRQRISQEGGVTKRNHASKHLAKRIGPQGAPAHADFSQESKVGAAGKPSVASSGPPRGAEARLQVGRRRFALGAGLCHAGIRPSWIAPSLYDFAPTAVLTLVCPR